jgi:hypothetical protein
MKRVTVAITASDDYSTYNLREVRSAMVNAAVLKAAECDLEISNIEAKVGTPRKSAS